MPIEIAYDVDLGGNAQAKLDALAETVRRELPADFERGGELAGRRFGEKMSNGIGLSTAHLKELFTKELPGLMGDMGDAAGMLAKDFGLLNEETADSVERAASLMEKGGQLGATLGGPLGAGLGVAVGGLISLRTEMVEAEHAAWRLRGAVIALGQKALEDMPKWAEEMRKQQEATDRAWAGMTSAGGLARREELSEGAKALAEEFGFIEKGVSGAGKAAKEAKGPFDALFETFDKADKARAEVRALNDEVLKMLEADLGTPAAPAPVLPDMEALTLPFPEASAFNSELENSIVLLGGMRDAADDLGAALLDGIGNTAAEAFGVMFDNISEGEKLFAGMGQSLRKSTSDMLKSLGKELIADGTKNILVGTGTSLLGLPNGPALIALGGTEIASGAAMGATGGFLGKGMGGKGAAGGGGDSLARDMAREEQMQRLSTMFYNPRTGEFYTGNDPEARFDPVHSQGTSSRSRRGSSGGAIDAGPPIRGVDPGTRGGGDGGGGTSITVNVDASGALFAEGGPEKLGNTIAMTINKAMFDGQGQAVTMAVAIGGVEALPRLGVGSVLY
jgi:hypothetical protein